MEPIIKIENLSVAYDLGKTSEMWALKDVSLEIYPQEYVIFFGPSGCGKSTLLYTIAGLEYPTKGTVIVGGKDIKSLTPEALMEFHKRTIGMIFQAFYLIPNFSVRDNIALPQILTEQPSVLRKQKVKALLDRFGLSEIRRRKASRLSGGQQQRVAIARSLINKPSIILADEPVGNLDSKNAELVLNLLGELNEKDKKTVIHVTHDPRYLYHANRVFYMKDGKINRVVRNPEKMSLLPFKDEKEISELERMVQAYPYLTDTKLKAKLILNHILYPYGIEIQDDIEKIIDQYLLNQINAREMKERLDLPLEKGGVSLYKQKAKEMADKITALASEISLIQEEKLEALTPVEEKAMTVRGFLLDEYSGKLSFEQMKRLEEAIANRIIGKFQKKDFERMIDRPFRNGGVGLNRRTAQRFAREVELILMKR